MSNPSLQDVRNRRLQIWSQVASLTEEDRELYMAEKVLLRLSDSTERAPLPLSVVPPAPNTASPSMSDALTSGSFAITTRLHPSDFSEADLRASERIFAEAEEEEEEEEEDDENDGGEGLVKLVRDVMSGNESLEQLTLLLFRNCSDTWWTATEIQEYLQRIKGKDVPMGSVSPLLTALKNSGVIVRHGHDIALAEKASSEVLR